MAKKENKQSHLKKIISKVKDNNENGARKTLLEELFNDFNRSRVQVYKMNLVRGISFGAGSVIGGTLVIALIAWILSMLAHIFPPLQEFFSGASQTIESNKK